MTLDECDRLFASVRSASSPSEACYSLAPLFDAYEVISIELARGQTFWRARIAPDRPWASVAEMSYPPAQFVSTGRLNDPRAPCFYAATRENTALAEIGVKTGDFVQIAGFRVKVETPIRIAVVGELYHIYKTGYLRLTGTDPGLSLNGFLNELGREQAERLLYIDAFLASLLSDSDASKNDYVLSRSVASMIYRNMDIDGIIFPSVRDIHGMNLALKPDSFDQKVHPVCCIHAHVKKLRLFGFVDYDVLHDAERLSPDGDLAWLTPQDKQIRRFFNLTREEFEKGLTSTASQPRT